MDDKEPAAPGQPPLPDLFARLVDEGEDFVRAEIGLYRAQAVRRLVDGRWAAALIGGALVLLFAATIALILGLLMTLATRVGPGWATLIMVTVTLALAALFARLGGNRVKAMLKDDDR